VELNAKPLTWTMVREIRFPAQYLPVVADILHEHFPSETN
jgi:hypothetical protein